MLSDVTATGVPNPLSPGLATWPGKPANLLVVFLLVELYNLMRVESREILPRAGSENPWPPEEKWL